MSSGIQGLDRILGGGYPAGCPTIIRGASGTGKTILALCFACATPPGEPPAVVVTFDESPDAILRCARGLHLAAAAESVKDLPIIDLRPDAETLNAGANFELGGMLARVELALDTSGTSRLVFDSFDTLFRAFDDKARLYMELKRIFDWCRSRGVTLVATSGEETGYTEGTALGDYASDCAIRLAQSIQNRLMTRTLHVQKCRGRGHGTNEYPFLIDRNGISITPVSDSQLTNKVSKRTLSTGIPSVDDMLGGKGVFEHSIVLVSGQSGTGKSLLAASMAENACVNGRRVHYLSFEESPDELARNTRAIGIDLGKHLKSGRLTTTSLRAVEHGLEEHLIRIMQIVEVAGPDLLILDPVTAFSDVGRSDATSDVKGMMLRLAAFLKSRAVTTLMVELLPDDSRGVSSLNISSLIDTWIRLRLLERHGEFNRLIHIGKSRGLASTNQVREFRITGRGLAVEEPYVGPDGMVFGTEKRLLEAGDARQNRARQREIRRLELELEREQLTMERQAALEHQLRAQKIAELEARIAELRESMSESGAKRQA